MHFFIVGSVAINSPVYGVGTGQVVLFSVQCVGTEARLTECPDTATVCSGSNYNAGVSCQTRTTGIYSTIKYPS